MILAFTYKELNNLYFLLLYIGFRDIMHAFVIGRAKRAPHWGVVLGTQTFSAGMEGLGTELRKPSHFGM